METILESPVISKSWRNNQFIGLYAEFIVMQQSIVDCKCSNRTNTFHLLCLHGNILPNQKLELPRMQVKITESKEMGPLYINKGKNDFFIYNNGAVRKLLDVLNMNFTSELVGEKLKVYNNPKGYWVVDINFIKS